MRRFFFWLLFIVAFFRSDLADNLFYDGNDSLTNWFNKLSDAAEEQAMSEFKKKADPIFAGLQPHQVEYAGHVMKDRETLGVFYLRYCKGEDKNPYVYGVTLSEFCELIGQAGILKR
jgi:phage/plasmid-associated DNA primase